MSPADVTIAEGKKLRALGLNPIPILNKLGHCTKPHTLYRDEGMPEDVFEAFVRDGMHGIQLSLGGSWRIVVLDVDGLGGATQLERLRLENRWPATVTCRTPRNGWQFYFRLPPWASVPSVDLWKGSGKHQGIELLSDRKLARCYPSYKMIDGAKVYYKWQEGRAPWENMIATLPGWITAMAQKKVAEKPAFVMPKPEFVKSQSPRTGKDWRTVLASVNDKVGVCSQWGLRVVGSQPNQSGWIKCRSIFREDRNPSAMFHAARGIYWEPGLPKALSYIDVMMQLRSTDFPTVLRELESSCR